MHLTEHEVERAFVAYLVERGWDVTTVNDDFTDLIAKRGAELLIAELKGHTKSAGTAIDIGYGQLLRRMNPDLEAARYALVVPESLAMLVSRVHPAVRRQVQIEVFAVAENGAVREL